MKLEKALNIAIGCVMASNIHEETARDIINTLTELMEYLGISKEETE